MKVKVFGIPNCGSVKKARVWLESNNFQEEFHDYKKLGIDKEHLEKWCNLFGWEKVLNKKGTTWRNLSDEEKAKVTNQDSAIALMLNNTSVIKRPVLESPNGETLGFEEAELEKVHK